MITTTRNAISPDNVAYRLSELHNEDLEELSEMEKEFYFKLGDAIHQIKSTGKLLSLVNLSKILNVSTRELNDYTEEILSLEDRYTKNIYK